MSAAHVSAAHLPADITVFVLSTALFRRYDYLLKLVMAEWEARGLAVAVVDRADAIGPSAVVVSHLDVTTVDPRIARTLERHPMVVNRSNTDISKRRISDHLIRHPATFHGPVIVKTNLNHGGVPEQNVRGGRALPVRALGRLRRSLPWFLSGLMQPGHYKIFDSAGDVPWPVWSNRHLVVEKFLPEMCDGLYGLRHHFFLGDRHCDYRLLSESPVVKSNRVVAFERIAEAPPQLLALRRRLGLDYGRIDYVVRQGEVVVFDTNRTPAYAAVNRTFPYAEIVRHLAGGLDTFRETREAVAVEAPTTRAAWRHDPLPQA